MAGLEPDRRPGPTTPQVAWPPSVAVVGQGLLDLPDHIAGRAGDALPVAAALAVDVPLDPPSLPGVAVQAVAGPHLAVRLDLAGLTVPGLDVEHVEALAVVLQDDDAIWRLGFVHSHLLVGPGV
jgi:hypothetical protein